MSRLQSAAPSAKPATRRDVLRKGMGLALAMGASAALLAGCAAPQPLAPAPANLIEINQRAADALLQGVQLDPAQPLLVASFVNLDVLTESSSLGRLFSEQVAGRVVNRGYQVVELKLRENLFFRGQGALLLSREIGEVSRAHKAQAVIVGTYTASREMLYVSLKLVGTPPLAAAAPATSNIVLAAHDYAVPMDPNVRSLLVR